MAVSVSTVTKGRSNDVWGTRQIGLFRVTFDSSYPTGGEAFDLKAYGFQGPAQAVFVAQRDPNNAQYVVQYDHDAEKLVAFWVDTTVDGAALAEVANTTNLSTLVVDVLVIGE